ncbi:MAG: beta-N-acetylhexosaminidase [Planctomycetota bacterium]
MSTAATVTELWRRGYSLLPAPREVRLAEGDVTVDDQWTLAEDGPSDPAARDILAAGLAEETGRPPAQSPAARARVITLSIRPGAVQTGACPEIDRQGYRLEIGPERIIINGNAAPGLFYGAVTLRHLLRRAPEGRGAQLPAGVITDWPDRELRILHYDTKHHQERLAAVLDLITRAALFKANAVAWEIEDKFAYRGHPEIGAPGAFTADELRAITAHALRHHVEIIPIVQGPSHLAFVLKHPAFAPLREDPANNYMLCPSKEASYQLLFSMYDELIAATPGARFFHVGTDEPYFLGDGEICGCRARREAIGRGGMMAEFIARCAGHLASRGRRVLCWGESPMTARDVPRLPPGIINAVFQNEAMGRAYRERGIRELNYCPTQGARPIFPEYFLPPHPAEGGVTHVRNLHETLCHGPACAFDPQGVIIGAWDDSGLHLETFWLGWALGAAWGWNPASPAPDEAAAAFHRIFHGPEVSGMTGIYRGLDELARFWTHAWDTAPSRRGPSYPGRSHLRYDATLEIPRVPDPDTLDNRPFFRKRYAPLLEKSREAAARLAAVTESLLENIPRARRNQYAMEVFLTLAAVVGDFLKLLEALEGMEAALDAAREDALRAKRSDAPRRLEEAAGIARRYVENREAMFRDLVAVWEKTRLPKGGSAGGKPFVHIMDDTKDHLADRTPDLGYIIQPSRDLHLENWAAEILRVAGEYRKRHPDTVE